MAVFRRTFLFRCVAVIGIMFCMALYSHISKRPDISLPWKSNSLLQQKKRDTPKAYIETLQTQKTIGTQLKNKHQILSLYKSVCHAYDSDIQILQPKLQFKSLVLVITLNNPLYEIIPLVELQYRPLFPNIVYCISNGNKSMEIKNWDLNIVYYKSPPEVPGGLYNYICVDYVHQLGLKANGFLFMSDDVLVSPKAVAKFSKQPLPATTVCKFQRYNCTPSAPCKGRYLQETSLKMADMRRDLKLKPEDDLGRRCDRTVQKITGQKQPFIHCLPDIYFIPFSLMEDASELFRLFYKYRIFHGVPHTHILLCLSAPLRPNAWDYIVPMIPHVSDFTKRAPHVVSGNKMVVHPVKLSPLLKRTEKYDKYFCNSILPFLNNAE